MQQLEAKIKVLESMVGQPQDDAMVIAGGPASLALSGATVSLGTSGSLISSLAFPMAAPNSSREGLVGPRATDFPSLELDVPTSGFVATVAGGPESNSDFWLPAGSSTKTVLNVNHDLAMRFLSSSSNVDRPLSLFDTELPDNTVMNSLFRVYTETLGNLILYSPAALRYKDASPLVRLAMSALGARYLPECAAFGEALFQRARKIIAPTLAGDVPPTIDFVQALLNLVIYAGVSNDEGELLWSHRELRQLTGFVKELGLDNEKKTVVTRNWTGQRVKEVDLNLRRSLFWTVFCSEQHFVLLDTFRGGFQDVDVNVGLPWADESKQWAIISQQPIRLSQFDQGLGDLAYSPFARTIFLHHIIRRMVDVYVESYQSQLRTGDFNIPVDLAIKRQWVRDKLEEFFLAEVEYASQDAHQFGDVLIPHNPDEEVGLLDSSEQGRGGGKRSDRSNRGKAVAYNQDDDTLSEADGVSMFSAPFVDNHGNVVQKQADPASAIFLRRLQAKNSLPSKAIIYHGLCAFVGCPREDLEAFFDITNVGYEPINKFERQRARERLARWINLPVTFAAKNLAAGGTLVPDEATTNVLTIYDHVAGLVRSVQELLEANPTVSFVHPLTLWCVWMCGVLDLARFVLSESLPDPETDARIPFILQVLKHVTTNHTWPFAASYIEGFERMYEWALRSKASQVVASLTLQPDPAKDHMLDFGLRFFPKGSEASEDGVRSMSSSAGSVVGGPSVTGIALSTSPKDEFLSSLPNTARNGVGLPAMDYAAMLRPEDLHGDILGHMGHEFDEFETMFHHES